jgi:hypothetical protein
MSANLDMSTNKITNLINPSNPNDAVNLIYLEQMYYNKDFSDFSYLNRDGDNSMNGNITFNSGATIVLNDTDMNAGSNKITNLADSTLSSDALNLGFADNRFMRLNGTNSMSGNLDAGSNKIVNVSDPTSNQDVITLNYFNNNTSGLSQSFFIYPRSDTFSLGTNTTGDITRPSGTLPAVGYYHAVVELTIWNVDITESSSPEDFLIRFSIDDGTSTIYDPIYDATNTWWNPRAEGQAVSSSNPSGTRLYTFFYKFDMYTINLSDSLTFKTEFQNNSSTDTKNFDAKQLVRVSQTSSPTILP